MIFSKNPKYVIFRKFLKLVGNDLGSWDWSWMLIRVVIMHSGTKNGIQCFGGFELAFALS